MKQSIKWAIPFAAAFLLAACGNSTSNENKMENSDGHNHSAMKNEQGPAQSVNQSVTINNDQLNAVYQHYIHLTTALTNGDVAEAKKASNAIEAGAKDLEGGASIAASAAKITAASGIEAQRTTYAQLSKDMIALVKKSGVKNGEVYVDYCPMALNDKGAYWLSSKKEIRNPYFGEKMLNCGEVKETIQ